MYYLRILRCRQRKSRTYSVVKMTESSAAYVNRRVDSPSDSEAGGQRDDIQLQTIDPKSTIVLHYVCVCVCVCVLEMGQFCDASMHRNT